jgi:hypothetical protein
MVDIKYSKLYLTIPVVSVKMTHMVTRRWLLGSVLVCASAAFAVAQPASGAKTVRWQIEAGG